MNIPHESHCFYNTTPAVRVNKGKWEIDMMPMVFNLPFTFPTRQAWRKAIRNIIKDNNAYYTMEGGNYFVTIQGTTYEFFLTDNLEVGITQHR